jgi:hypothetical protein
LTLRRQVSHALLTLTSLAPEFKHVKLVSECERDARSNS